MQTAADMAIAYREIEVAEKLLAEIKEALAKAEVPDIRDVFGRQQRALQLGVPNSDRGHRLFHVPYEIAIPVLEATIASHRAALTTLNQKAASELAKPETTRG
ncbi:hypothetical protein [Sphingomonas azotifigens]|uniref:hypothetical protein n=1 Tax=Sphingomonas azotifigens TaxID=330920 RepID=UPI001C3F755B|nr:hypothetical protein [Sphingomonas azotifigens]